MKYIVVVPDGMADLPLDELGKKTPMEAARTTNMDYLVQKGMTGLIQTIPEGMSPGSDVGNLALLGYDPKSCYSGRAPLEAANLDIKLAKDQLAFRCNLVTVENHEMVDYSAGHIGTKEASELIDALNHELADEHVEFYPGKGYRHLLILKVRNVENYKRIKCVPPHDILHKNIKKYLPSGQESEMLLKLMERSKEIFKKHTVNSVRIDLNENPATMIWLWGQGTRPELPAFKKKYGVNGAIISAVDLVNGIGRLAGLEIVNVPGATGYYDTNYAGKAEYALESLQKNDFVFIHIEAPDEAGHNGDAKAKIEAIENIDRHIVGEILNRFDAHDDVRVVVLPDHPTPVSLRTHTSDPVPFVMYGKGIQPDEHSEFSERVASEAGLVFKNGEEMMQHFISHNVYA